MPHENIHELEKTQAKIKQTHKKYTDNLWKS